jgi:peptide deformylase
MAIQRIRQLGDPVLRARSVEVPEALGTLPQTLGDLRDTLHEFQRTHGFGRGISAVQIGVLERVIYIEFGGVAYCLVNPEVVRASEERFQLWDDCFSFPDLLCRVERALRVTVRYEDEHGVQGVVEAEGALSELLQHEMDHLDGVLAVDRAVALMTRGEWERVGAGGA